jgi:SpoVK/Ycf46/Vps4 family AAA+-type ATPase
MSTARHILALLKSHLEGDDKEFLSVAMQAAAHEARLGHASVAQQLRDLIDEAKRRTAAAHTRGGQIIVLEPRGELASLLSVQTPRIRLNDMVLSAALAERLRRVLVEQRQQKKLREHALHPRRKLLFVGPPGSGKTMTASALAGELHLPLFTIMLEGLITKFMGETAAKLRLVFDALRQTQGIYLFDEFDALGAHRNQANDVGEIRRVLNSFLQFLEKDTSNSLIVAATNHPEMLDRALFRRFDDVIEYMLPDPELAKEILSRKLAPFETADLDWSRLLSEVNGLSQAELARASEEAAKQAVLGGSTVISSDALFMALQERKAAFVIAATVKKQISRLVRGDLLITFMAHRQNTVVDAGANPAVLQSTKPSNMSV